MIPPNPHRNMSQSLIINGQPLPAPDSMHPPKLISQRDTVAWPRGPAVQRPRPMACANTFPSILIYFRPILFSFFTFPLHRSLGPKTPMHFPFSVTISFNYVGIVFQMSFNYNWIESGWLPVSTPPAGGDPVPPLEKPPAASTAPASQGASTQSMPQGGCEKGWSMDLFLLCRSLLLTLHGVYLDMRLFEPSVRSAGDFYVQNWAGENFNIVSI